jgi:hypothetical protein
MKRAAALILLGAMIVASSPSLANYLFLANPAVSGGGGGGGSVQAARALDLQNTFGVTDLVGQDADKSHIVADVQYLGIKKWRDGFWQGNSSALTTFQNLVNAGVRLIGWDSGGNVSGFITAAQAWAALGANAIFALEGPNEPGGFNFHYETYDSTGGSKTWHGVSDYMRDLRAAVHADGTLGPLNLPIWSPTNVFAQNDNWGVQYATVPAGPPAGVLQAQNTVLYDSYTTHVYPMYHGRGNYIDPTNGDSFDQQLTADFLPYSPSSPTLGQLKAAPRGITESGFGTNCVAPNATCLSQVVAGKNLLSGMMNAYAEGYSAFCIYSFYQQGDGFGLFSAPQTPLTQGVYIHNFTTPIADAGATAATFSPGSLNYTIGALPSTGKSALFEKSNGYYELIIWNNVVNWNYAGGSAITVNPVTVTISFTTPQTTIDTWDPTISASPISSVTNSSSVQVALTDYPIIIGIMP